MPEITQSPKQVTAYDLKGDYIAIYFDDELRHWYHRPDLHQIFGWLGIPYKQHDLPPKLEACVPQSLAELQKRINQLERKKLRKELRRKQAEIAEIQAKLGEPTVADADDDEEDEDDRSAKRPTPGARP